MFVHVRCVEFLKLGCEVTVYVPSNDEESYVYNNIEVIKSPSKVINEQLKENDIIYLHLLNIYPFSKADGWLIYKHIIDNKIPFAMYVHGSEVQKYRARMFEFNYKITDFLKWFKKDALVIPKMQKFVEKTMNRKNSSFVFPSVWMKDDLEKNLNLNLLNKYFIIPTGIETDYFKYHNRQQNRYKIVTIRSLSNKVYDIEKTIEVLSILPNEFTLDIYGEGIYKNRYESIIKNKNLNKRIKIVSGFVEKKEMRNIFSNYGIYISTTKMDSQGVNMMEAMSAGLVVATTDNSSKREFITNLENGILGEGVVELANNIIKATKTIPVFNALAKKGRQSIEKINIKETVQKEVALLKEIASING